MAHAAQICECGCETVEVDGQQCCADTLAKFRLIHGYDYALRLRAGQSLGIAMTAPDLTAERYACGGAL